MPLSRKKVIVRKHNREWLAGYLPPADFACLESIELLDLHGKVTALPLQGIKWVCFVRDFNSGEFDNPERLLKKAYLGRPRGDGLWIRLKLIDDDLLEGMAANDLGLLSSDGVFLVPPDTRSNTQRVFIPRSTISEFQVVAVIASLVRRKPEASPQQEDLFQ